MTPNFKDEDMKALGYKVPKKGAKITRIKERVWKIASIVFRKIDADERGNGSYVKCVTCSTTLPWQDFDGGHFVPGKNNSVKFEKDDVHCQCRACNRYGHGMLAEYTLFMINKYGKKRTEELLAMKHKTKSFTRGELLQIECELREKAKELGLSV